MGANWRSLRYETRNQFEGIEKLGYPIKAYCSHLVGFFSFHRAGEFQRKKKAWTILGHFACAIKMRDP